MKRINILFAIALIAGFMACNKNDEAPTDDSIEGTYTGTLTASLKSAQGILPGSSNATMVVTKSGEELIQVHCFTDEIDTTFMLNYYEHNDSVMVCLNGEAFTEMYGHMMGQGHMGGGMMGDIGPNQSEWQHHMSDEHQPGDEHFGGFDRMNHSFGYKFDMVDGTSHYSMYFEGTKN
ncbi:hypothetical protein [Draconibacterium halophilum]|uniref:Uncharacterized protein n=1 Tax=Draconibacterium halophilum TaxID=2706887 RepID=A0A6C0RE24_9BACT|nr:hypothetical protein [Draconibacterium halophilum]QIA08369.1 hypothetical protein G0Q07_11890 [Draconibacterium halophilum]